LVRAEVPNARRIANQDYPFRPGIDITDVRQVKGLEFDYVILVDVNASTYIVDDESRHLLHIAATRAAHQLWIISTATPSRLIPTALLEA
jgi:DNA helicase-2/ATP-dependent DNA helicase PcrA